MGTSREKDEPAVPRAPRFKAPHVSEIFDLGKAGVVVITSVDVMKLSGTYALLQTREEAVTFIHDVSLKQSPKWHAQSCPTCAAKRKA